MRDYLESLFDDSCFSRPWKPVSRPELAAWLIFYAGFMVYAFNAHGGFLFIDSANLVVHEGGHNLFAWFGQTLCLWGGTILQWMVPFLLAVYFFSQRQMTGFAFSAFFFFENWLYTATYMADARAMELPLVTTGDPEFAEHDFHAIFTSLGVLEHDTQIATVVRILGWCGMLAVTGWLAFQALKKPSRSAEMQPLVFAAGQDWDARRPRPLLGQATLAKAEANSNGPSAGPSVTPLATVADSTPESHPRGVK